MSEISKCERCREYNAAAVDFRHQATKAQNDYATLRARHNALREAVHKAMGRTAECDKKQTDEQLVADVAYLKRLASDHFNTSVYCGNMAFAAEQKYDALREAVERLLSAASNLEIGGTKPAVEAYFASMAEADRLLEGK